MFLLATFFSDFFFWIFFIFSGFPDFFQIFFEQKINFVFLFAAIRLEAEHQEFKESIEGFQKDKLSKAETVEKNTLPTKEVIEAEKTA